MHNDFDDKGCWSTSSLEWATPERALEQEEFWTTFGHCIDALPQKLKVPFALRELDGIASEDVAQTLGTTRNNLWVMLSRARQWMRDCLDRHWFNT
jgi:RNA polymerase sigma-70 factor (ECF subfamily)